MSDDKQELFIPTVPKRKKRAEVELDLTLDAPADESKVPAELRVDEPRGTMVDGLVMARVQGGYMLIDISIPEAELSRYATKIRPPEMFAIVRSQAEQRLDAMCEEQSKAHLTSLLRSTGGMYTPTSAMEALVEEIAVLTKAFWPDTPGMPRIAEGEASNRLRVFWETGIIYQEPGEGRAPTGADRERLQRLVHHAGGWPGVAIPALVHGGGAT